MEFHDFKITLREILLSTVIICIFLGLGILISSAIENRVSKHSQNLISSVQVETKGEFKYCIDTEVGRFISCDTLAALDPVSISDIPDSAYMYIERVKERYTMHTQVCTTSDGKGHIHTHTRHYWSWDKIDSDTWGAKKLSFLGQDLFIKYPSSKYLKTESCGLNLRYQYYVVPRKVQGVLRGITEDKALKELKFIPETTIEKYVKNELGWDHAWITVFWILWIILLLGCIFLFYYGEYEWLERD